MVCASIREDNPIALASGLSSVQTHKPYNKFPIAPACIIQLLTYVEVDLECYSSVNIILTNAERRSI